MWDTIPLVDTAITLVAFLAALAAWYLGRRSREKENLIRNVPEAERGPLVASTLEFFNIDPSNLSANRQYQIAIQQIRYRAIRFYVTSLVIVVLSLIIGYFLFRSGDLPSEKPKTTLQLLDSTTNQPIWRPEIEVHYVCRGESERRVELSDHLGRVKVDPGVREVVMVNNVSGLELAKEAFTHESEDLAGNVFLDRMPSLRNGYLKSIQPASLNSDILHVSKNEYQELMNRLPEEIRERTDGEWTFSFDNQSDEFQVDVLIYRYVFPGEKMESLNNTWIPYVVAPGKTRKTLRGSPLGYFLIYASLFGKPARLIDKGSLFGSPDPVIELNPKANGMVEGKLSHYFGIAN